MEPLTWWIDAQLSPALALWLNQVIGAEVQASSVRQLGLRDATDALIFAAARQAKAVVLTKDIDFVHLLSRSGPPPQVIWLTCGNTSTAALRSLLAPLLLQVIALLRNGEALVEISGR